MKTRHLVHSIVATALLAGASSPLMAADGRHLFKTHCSTCHGDGARPTTVGAALKARNLTTDPYKQGDSVADILKTLETGVPGTGMASYKDISLSDRQKLASYVAQLRHGSQGVVAKVAQEVKSVAAQVQAKSAPVVAEAKAVVAKVQAQAAPVVEKAQAKVAAATQAVVSSAAQLAQDFSFDKALARKGEAAYKAQCASCHGDSGKADTPTGMALKARNLVDDAYKQGDSLAQVSKTLETGVPGTAMASFAHLGEDREAVAAYVVALRKGISLEEASSPKAKASAAAPAGSDKAAENPLIAEGRTLYKKGGCASCHGENGQADTPTGMALKARNFVVGGYKKGASIEGISDVLQNGLAGTAMAAYPQYDAEQRKALATFLLALKDNPQVADSPEPKAAVGAGKTSIAFAMSKLAEPVRYPKNVNFMDGSAGAQVYAENCASCHGDNGQGGVATRMVSAAPYYRVTTAPILGHDGDWMKEADFVKLVTEGTPGKVMPGLGTLTRQELKDLYSFFKASLDKAK